MARIDTYTEGIKNADYARWLREVDEACSQLSGVSVFDLPDQAFWGWYADGYTPIEMARRALEEEGWSD